MAREEYGDLELKPSTLENIDTALYRFLDEALNLHSETAEGVIKVPVVFASAERTFLSKKTAEGRDSDGTLNLPIISVERTTVSKDLSKTTSYYGPTPFFIDSIHGSYIRINRRIVEDKTNNFAVADNIKNLDGVRRTPNGQAHFPSNNKKIVTVSYYVPRPISINVNYNIIVKTNYLQQMNNLVVPFINIGDYAKMVKISNDGHFYEAFFNGTFNTTNTVSNLANNERTYQTSITVGVIGYLIGEGDNQIRAKVIKRENVVEVKIPRERVIVGDVQQLPESSGFYKD
tara:strand:- start:1947 stop:2810 length:864 start_codon:yes stop_codon:yes gene_type:complete